MKQSKYLLFVFLWIGFWRTTISQPVSLFKDDAYIRLVLQAADHIYSLSADSAKVIAQEIERIWPNNPVVPLIEAEALLWQHIPLLEGETFYEFQEKLTEVIVKSHLLPQEMPEATFFEMAARGLKAEYFADKGLYIKAINEASSAYSLVKKSMDQTDEFSEFLFAAGVYNYFREVYPEKYPVYKPLIWWFRSGDRTKGLSQLYEAVNIGIITCVEASVYLSYIYLRYENKPELAIQILERVVDRYPNNYFLVIKYYEALVQIGKVATMEQNVIDYLQSSRNAYYHLAGLVYGGMYAESELENSVKAFELYAKAINLVRIPNHGEQHLAWAYFGAGRILFNSGKINQAKSYFDVAAQHAETVELKKEIESWILKVSK